jgi:hypothetical protein
MFRKNTMAPNSDMVMAMAEYTRFRLVSKFLEVIVPDLSKNKDATLV